MEHVLDDVIEEKLTEGLAKGRSKGLTEGRNKAKRTAVRNVFLSFLTTVLLLLFLHYRNIYFNTNKIASTYISTLIFFSFALPVSRFSTT